MKTKNLVAKQLSFVAILLTACLVLSITLIVNSFIIHSLKNQQHTSAEAITNVETVVIEKEVLVEVEKEVIVEVEKEVNYTYDELYCMAVVIYNEAGGNACTDEHREFVGYVVLNRVNDSRFPDTIREVLEQPGQYEGLGKNGVNFDKRSSNAGEAKAVERAWATAKKVLNNRENIPIPENVIFQAEFEQGNGVYKQIGNTYFCY
jgi:hypothetical protein